MRIEAVVGRVLERKREERWWAVRDVVSPTVYRVSPFLTFTIASRVPHSIRSITRALYLLVVKAYWRDTMKGILPNSAKTDLK